MNHYLFPIQFKIQIETFLNCLRIFSSTILKSKVPKPLQEIIIRFISIDDFGSKEEKKIEENKYTKNDQKCSIF